MHRGTLFAWLFLALSSGITMLLVWRNVRRALRESELRWKIVIAAAVALALWGLATYVTFDAVFLTAWSVAHMRPFPDAMFPEGWPIYVWLGAYAIVGVALLAALGRVPARRSAADRAS